jgi:hypothetical protein
VARQRATRDAAKRGDLELRNENTSHKEAQKAQNL